MSTQKKIKFIQDKNGNKTDVIIPLKKYMDILEDLEDLKVIKKRKNDKEFLFNDARKILGLDNG